MGLGYYFNFSFSLRSLRDLCVSAVNRTQALTAETPRTQSTRREFQIKTLRTKRKNIRRLREVW
jgi:hypothetical protein